MTDVVTTSDPEPPAETPAVETPAVETPSTETPPAEAPSTEPTPAEAASVPLDVSGFGLTEEFSGQLKEFAEGAKLDQKGLSTLAESFKKSQAAAANATFAEMQQKGTKLVESWGEAKPANLNKVKTALKYVDKTGEVAKMLQDTGYGNHPAIIEMFLKVGDDLTEGGFIESAVNTPSSNKTAAQLMFGKTHPN